MRSGELIAERFEIAAEAGAGGMSVVYRARDRVSGNLVALKVLQGAELSGRFQRESRVLAELDHPGIVRYVAHGATAAGQRYLAMEWLDGEDLAERLSHGGLTARESVVLAGRVATALGFAHARGVVHRDIKPSNLFLSDRAVEKTKAISIRASTSSRSAACSSSVSPARRFFRVRMRWRSSPRSCSRSRRNCASSAVRFPSIARPPETRVY